MKKTTTKAPQKKPEEKPPKNGGRGKIAPKKTKKKSQPKRYSDKQIIAALEATGGMVATAAGKIGMSFQGMYKRINEEEEIGHALHAIRERNLDIAESKVMSSLRRGKPWAICFYLKCQGKHRGWVERQERTGKDGEPLNPTGKARAILETMTQEEATRLYLEQIK